uniref:Uncharacterized protein n=1 Tax=Arundo donax TaxID=35708 RepID=A0A0A9GV43_ARUDO
MGVNLGGPLRRHPAQTTDNP